MTKAQTSMTTNRRPVLPAVALLLALSILTASEVGAAKIILGNVYYPEISGSVFMRNPDTQEIQAEIELVFHALENFATTGAPANTIDVFIASAYVPEGSDLPVIDVCAYDTVTFDSSDLMHPKLGLVRKEVLVEVTPGCPERILGIGYIMNTADIEDENIFPAFSLLVGEGPIGSLYSDKDGLILPGLTFEQLAQMLPNDGWTAGAEPTSAVDETHALGGVTDVDGVGFTSAVLGVEPLDLAPMPPCTSSTNIMIHAKPNQPLP